MKYFIAVYKFVTFTLYDNGRNEMGTVYGGTVDKYEMTGRELL